MKSEYSKKYHLVKSYMKKPLKFGDVLLYQIGRLHCKTDTVIPVHTHLDWYELTVVLDGKGKLITNGKEIDIEQNDIFLSYPGDFHGINPNPDFPLKYDFFAFWFDGEKMLDTFREIAGSRTSLRERKIRDERITELLSDAISEINVKNSENPEIIEAQLKLLILYLIDDMKKDGKIKRQGNVSSAEELCYQMINYIDKNIYGMTGLSEMSEAMNYNYSYLSDLFCRVTGDTLMHYYTNRRLDAGKLLILEGKLKIGEIATLVGYSSVYSFSRAFTKKFGKPPTKFLEKTNIDN